MIPVVILVWFIIPPRAIVRTNAEQLLWIFTFPALAVRIPLCVCWLFLHRFCFCQLHFSTLQETDPPRFVHLIEPLTTLRNQNNLGKEIFVSPVHFRHVHTGRLARFAFRDIANRMDHASWIWSGFASDKKREKRFPKMYTCVDDGCDTSWTANDYLSHECAVWQREECSMLVVSEVHNQRRLLAFHAS